MAMWIAVILLVVVAGIVVYKFVDAKTSVYPGAGQKDARGQQTQARAPPADVGDDQTASAVATAVSEAFKFATSVFGGRK